MELRLGEHVSYCRQWCVFPSVVVLGVLVLGLVVTGIVHAIEGGREVLFNLQTRFAEKNNLPKLEYVSLPRAGAMKVIMEEVGPHRDEGASTSRENSKKVYVKESEHCRRWISPVIYKKLKGRYVDNNFNQNNTSKMIIDTKSGDNIEWILDVTIAYPDRIPLHLQDIVCGIRPPCATHIHYRLYPSNEVPSDPEEMTQWLYDRFIEKDKLLEEFYRTGHFPVRGNNSQSVRQVRQDNLRYLILHLFFIASTFLQYKICCELWSYLW